MDSGDSGFSATRTMGSTVAVWKDTTLFPPEQDLGARWPAATPRFYKRQRAFSQRPSPPLADQVMD